MLGDDPRGRFAVRTVEITQGRLAMLGVTYFAAYEFLFHRPIVENNPFFHPNLWLPLVGIAWLAVSSMYQSK